MVKKSDKSRLQILAAILLVLVVATLYISFAKPKLTKIVNVHESVESLMDIAKLQTAMAEVGIGSVVLQSIPESFLYYDGSQEIDLSAVAENEENLQRAVSEYPEVFQYFCSVDPSSAERMQALEDCFEAGAIGVKMYNGYSYSHVAALDDPGLDDFYKYINERDGILMLPVNTNEYASELENLLISNPDLPVICSHYCLSTKSLSRASYLMSMYPNLYVDTSFGNIDFVKSGFETISASPEDFRAFVNRYQDRVLFATDAVITSYEEKTTDWVTALYSDYISILIEEEFSSEAIEGAQYRGMDLSRQAQKKVLWQNWESLLE